MSREVFIQSLLYTAHGALDRGDMVNKDEVIRAMIDATHFLALETHGKGNERMAIEKVKSEGSKRFKMFDREVRKGAFNGMSRGGFTR